MDEIKKILGKALFVIIFLCLFTNSSKACQYTIREIGYSSLAVGIYDLYVIDNRSETPDSVRTDLQQKLKGSNIQLVFLNPDTDGQHPVLNELKEKLIRFPVKVLVSPNGEILELPNQPIDKLVDWVLASETREKFRELCVRNLAVVVWVEGENKTTNVKTGKLIEDVIKEIESILPHLPKPVKNGPKVIRVSENVFQQEKVLFWSLGLDSVPDEPIAFVLYGRGRFMGQSVNYESMKDGALAELLYLTGFDCECQVDKIWMLGKQIPLSWDKDTQQEVFNEIGIDVENPMILAHMSRIMKMIFAPIEYFMEYEQESIPEDFPEVKQKEEVTEIVKGSSLKYYIFLAIFSVLVVGVIVFIKKKRY